MHVLLDCCSQNTPNVTNQMMLASLAGKGYASRARGGSAASPASLAGKGSTPGGSVVSLASLAGNVVTTQGGGSGGKGGITS